MSDARRRNQDRQGLRDRLTQLIGDLRNDEVPREPGVFSVAIESAIALLDRSGEKAASLRQQLLMLKRCLNEGEPYDRNELADFLTEQREALRNEPETWQRAVDLKTGDERD